MILSKKIEAIVIAAIVVFSVFAGIIPAIAQPHYHSPNYIEGINVTVNTTDKFNVSYCCPVGTPLEFQINNTLNLSAGTFNVTNQSGLTTNVTVTLDADAWFWVNASNCKPGTYWVNVSNTENSSEYVNFTVDYYCNATKINISDIPGVSYTADGKWYNKTVSAIHESCDVVDTRWTGDITVRNNQPAIGLYSPSTGEINVTSVNVTLVNGTANVSVSATGPSAIDAYLNATDPSGELNSTDFVNHFNATTKTGFIHGQFTLHPSGDPVFGTTTDPVKVHVYNNVTGALVDDTQSGAEIAGDGITRNITNNIAEYTAEVPAGYEYRVIAAQPTKFLAGKSVITATVEEGETEDADIVFVSILKPVNITIEYVDGTDSRTNLADGMETTCEQLVIQVFDQNGTLIDDTVGVNISGVGDLNVNNPTTNPDGSVTTSVTVTLVNGEGHVWVTSFGANTTTMSPEVIRKENITATSKTNISLKDTAEKIYILRGNNSISGNVDKVDPDHEEIYYSAEGVVVWAAYPGVNQTLAYAQANFEWMVDIVNEQDHYELNGLVYGDIFEPGDNASVYYNRTVTDTPTNVTVIIYAKDGLEGGKWDGINDTINASTIYSQGEGVIDWIRGSSPPPPPTTLRTFDRIADAEFEYIAYEGETNDHNLKLEHMVGKEYMINFTETKHDLAPGIEDTAELTIYTWHRPEGSVLPWEPEPNMNVKVNITSANLSCTLSNETASGVGVDSVLVTTNESGINDTVTFHAGNKIGDVNITAWLYKDGIGDAFIIKHYNATKHIVTTAQISGDVTDPSGKHLATRASQGRVIVVLWRDNDTADVGVNPLIDRVVWSANGNQTTVHSVPYNSEDVVLAKHPGAKWAKQTYSAELYNARFAADDGHYSFVNVTSGINYILEAIVVESWTAQYFETGFATAEDVPPGTTTKDIVVPGIEALETFSVNIDPSSVVVNVSTTVTVTATDEDTTEPVVGATVSLSGCGVTLSDTTNAVGIATFDDVNATSTGTIDVTVSKSGYAPREGAITVSESGVDDPYDANHDRIVDIDELMNAIDDWKHGLYDIDGLMDTIGKWKAGSY